MKKIYETPEIKLFQLTVQACILTSGEGYNDPIDLDSLDSNNSNF